MWPDETILTCDLLEAAEFAPPCRLDRAILRPEAAVYIWLYVGDRRGAGRHLDAYYKFLTLTGWPMYIGSAKSLYHRRGRHVRNLEEVRDLSADEIEVAVIPMPSHAASLYAEALLIDAYQPVLNLALPGVGSARVQGQGRLAQRPSKFSLVHGREGRFSGCPQHVVDDLIDVAIAHLHSTVRGVRLCRRIRFG